MSRPKPAYGINERGQTAGVAYDPGDLPMPARHAG